MDKFLLDAFKSTDYKALSLDITIRVGEASKKLDSLLNENNVSTFCFITAYNPLSKELNETENKKDRLFCLKI